MSKCVVTVSRQWHLPQITTSITGEGIAIQMSLEDYLTALEKEIGSVAFTFRQATFAKDLRAASVRVVQGMKDETIKVV